VAVDISVRFIMLIEFMNHETANNMIGSKCLIVISKSVNG